MSAALLSTARRHDDRQHEEDVDEVEGTFVIGIILRNDNAPVRVVDRAFYVVEGAGRLLGQ